MRQLGRAAPVLVVLLVASACSARRARNAPEFEVHDAWIAAADSGATTAAYVRLVNGTEGATSVSGFATDAASRVEMHRTTIDASGATHMARADTIHIARFGTEVMKPGGLHLMLIGVRRRLVPGERVFLSMHVSTGAIVSTSARVRTR